MGIADDIINGTYKPSFQAGKKKKSVADQIIDGTFKMVRPDDITFKDIPIKEEEKRTWFSGGAFSDGFDILDIPRTITGTTLDLQQDMLAGIVEMPEKIVDAGATMFGKGAEFIGLDELADKTKDFIAKDSLNSNKIATMVSGVSPTGVMHNILNGNFKTMLGNGESIEKNSLLGEKTDSLAQSGGQLAGTIGLQAVGVPWQLTTGVTSFGAESEQAFQNDATYNEAIGSGIISAGAEILFESLFKIPGIKASGSGKVGNKLIGKLVDGFTNDVTTRNALNWVISAFGEGGEEVATGIFQNLGQALTYENEVTLQEFAESEEARSEYFKKIAEKTFGKEAWSEYGEAFVGGMALGGAFGTPNAIKMSKQGRDINTGLTNNEQAVLDEVTNKRLEEALKKNENLSKKEQDKIREEARKDLEKGLVDTDTIESILAGETYSKYKESDARLTTLQTEIASLNEKVNTGEITLKEMKRLESLKQRLSTIEADSQQTQAQLQQEMSQKIGKDNYLQRSYYERGQRSKQFTYEAREDMTELEKVVYDSAARVMNNTTRSHEVADAVAKISKDRGSKYVFVNNEMLKRSYKQLSKKTGKEKFTIDGFKNAKGEVILNIDSPKILEKIIGHETTHLLEGTNEYKLLQDAVKEYATTKGEYDTKLQSLTKMYEGTDANIDAEITSDLVGDYLFTDENFVNHLSAKQPNIFKRIYEHIKHLVKQFTAGSKEARQLEKLKYRFEQAYRSVQKSGQKNTDTKYSLSNDIDTKIEHELDASISDQLDIEDGDIDNIVENIVRDTYKPSEEATKDEDVEYEEFLEYNNQVREKIETKLKELGLDRYGDGFSEGGYNANSKLMSAREEIINYLDNNNIEYEESNSIYAGLFPSIYVKNANGDVVLRIGNHKNSQGASQNYTNREIVENTQKIIEDIKKATQDTKYSLTDSKGRELTKEQQEHFKDSKVRDENGNLKVMYHGTSNYGFTIFDYGSTNFGLFGQGFYFTDAQDVAESYTEKGKGQNKGVYEVYLNIKNPLDMDIKADAKWNNIKVDGEPIENYLDVSKENATNEDYFKALKNYAQDVEMPRWEAHEFIAETIESMGYDGITHIGGGRFNKGDTTRHQVYIAFDSSQIKNVDNVKPTENPDIRYSLSEEGTLVDNKGNEVKLETTDAGNHNSLMAIHNLSEEKLKGILELGGFPVPSIAIVDTDKFEYTDFGGISVLFDKDTIDPSDSRNEVYDRDAYSQTFPDVEYDINNESMKKMLDTHNIYRDYQDDISSEVITRYMYAENLGKQVNNMGKEATIEKLKNDDNLKYVYLKTIGEFQPIMEQRRYHGEISNDTLQKFVDNYKGETPLNELSYDQTMQLVDQVIETIRPDIEKEASQIEEKHRDKYIKLVLDSYKENYSYLNRFMMSAYKLQKYGVDVQKINTQATVEKANEVVNQEEFEKWVDNTWGKLINEATKGIRNNKDVFTPSGNRRNFKQLHDEYNLRNIVQQMIKGRTTGGEGGITEGSFGSIAAKLSRRFDTISEIKSAKDVLTTPEQSHEMLKPLKEKLEEDLRELSEYHRNTASYTAFDNSADAVSELAGKKTININTFKKVLDGWYSFKTSEIPDSVLKNIIDDLNALKNIPTDYFEAKPQRAVGLDEVQAIVIPNDTDVELKKQLTDAGLYVIEYDANVEGDRQAKINQFDDLKFSLSDPNEIAPTQRGTRSEDVKLQEAIAPIQQTINDLSEQLTRIEERITANEDDYAPVNEANLPELEQQYTDSFNTIDDDLAPVEQEAINPIENDQINAPTKDLFHKRDYAEVGNRKVKAYQYEHPELRPYFQEAAEGMLYDLNNSIKGERSFNSEVYYNSNGEDGFYGTTRHTAEDIAEMLDGIDGKYKMSYDDIRKGLEAIIEDHGAENNAASKRIEMYLDQRLRNGYTEIGTGGQVPANQGYIDLVEQIEYNEYASNIPIDESLVPQEASENVKNITEIPMENVNVSRATNTSEAIRPRPVKQPKMKKVEAQKEPKMVRVKKTQNSSSDVKQRKWVGTSTESDVVNREILPDDLDQSKIHYIPVSNRETLDKANTRLANLGYDEAVKYFKNKMAEKKVTVEDVALGERLLQEAMKKGDMKTAGELIIDTSILGTEHGQIIQALSIIKRLTPEGQVKMLHRIVERGKARQDKAFEGIELTQEMIDKILKTYKEDGTYDQKELNKAVEDVKQEIADNMKVTVMDKVNAWRYLAMLGNPKTHNRNIISNVAMRGTLKVKNALARTIETIAPIKNRTKTWEKPSKYVEMYAKQTTLEMKDVLMDDSKYNEETSIKAKRNMFKSKILNGVYNFNSNLLSKEDWWFSKPAFEESFREYLTANGIKTKQDIEKNPKLIEKAKKYATEQSQIATFRQYSWLANKIRDIENKNTATQIAVGSVIPFKKTPINIAKAGLSYSPLGFVKTLTYDAMKVKQGKMEASELIDHLAQNTTGTALTLIGYLLASAGFLNGGGEDDKEGKYDYQLGEQAYSLSIDGQTYSLSWLSPVAMPLFVGANAYEQLVEGKEWNGDVVVETLAQTLDPLSEMSFLSGLDTVLSSYDSGFQKFAGIGESMIQNYVTQFVPTLSSQIANTLDDKKRTTKVAADSDFKMFDETVNKLKYKIPFLRETLEPSTDIWGNEVKQNEDVFERAMESFIAPYSRKENIATEIDQELKDLYRETGENGVIPTIPYNYVNYDGEKYKMSGKEYTDFKKKYGQTSNDLLEDLFKTTTYKKATSEDKAKMVDKVYTYARDEAKKEYLAKENVTYTNATKDGNEYYKEGSIKGAIKNDMTIDEYEAYINNPSKYKVIRAIGDYSTYKAYSKELEKIHSTRDANKKVTVKREVKVTNYLDTLPIDYGAKILIYKMEYPSDNYYNNDIINYLQNRSDISYSDMVEILEALDMKVDSNGNVYWD